MSVKCKKCGTLMSEIKDNKSYVYECTGCKTRVKFDYTNDIKKERKNK